jgi:DNA-binding NarL/FixJ family response regulator
MYTAGHGFFPGTGLVHFPSAQEGFTKRITVLLADDHPILTETMAHFLRQHFEVVGIARDGRTMVEMARKHKPDVIVTDISMPELNGIDAARIIRKEIRSSRVLFLSMHTDLALIEEAFRIGANGFVLKISGAEELVKAIQIVAKGETYITPSISGNLITGLMTKDANEGSLETRLTSRQRQILQLLAEGKTMKEAAAVMSISTRTAESHKYEIMRKLGVTTTADLIRYAVRIKLV